MNHGTLSLIAWGMADGLTYDEFKKLRPQVQAELAQYKLILKHQNNHDKQGGGSYALQRRRGPKGSARNQLKHRRVTQGTLLHCLRAALSEINPEVTSKGNK